MSNEPHSPDFTASARAARIRQIIDQCVSLRAKGQTLTDEELLAAHPDLGDDLHRELNKLARIQKARRQAAEADTPTIGSGAMNTAVAAQVPADSASSHTVPIPPLQALPGYEILGEIHRGGQGVVYRALQKSTKRQVAVKILREGPFAGSTDQARFDREVEILGQLKHPNIVTIHDSGAAAGCFYFVMDYIPGQSLDQWILDLGFGNLDLQTPTVRTNAPADFPQSKFPNPKSKIETILRLFLKICDAVNTAHLRGIIHRDLKPGNIRIDENGEPHVLDFGLAKVALSSGAEVAQTQTGQFVGSLPWASPEQAEGAPSKMDLRTDVYSLGVILYQMLTGGAFPYSIQGGLGDILHNIRHAEPLRPSTLRGAHGRLARGIDDELETIVLKCLHKERERRYQSAGELARDIRHYLNNEPIEAKRDSAFYVLRKQLRRYRGAMLVASAFVILLLAATVVSTTWYLQAEEQARLARDAEREQKRQRDRAEDERRKAQTETAVANFRLREARRQANHVLLERAEWFPALRRTHDWTGFLPTDVRDDYPREVLPKTGQWLKAQLPEWFLLSGEIIPANVKAVPDAIYGLTETVGLDPANSRYRPLYDWLAAHETKIDWIAAATVRWEFCFGAPAISDPYQEVVDSLSPYLALSPRFARLLIARAAWQHLNGQDAQAAELLAAARRGIRLDAANRLLVGALYEIASRRKLYETISAFALDAAARGADPTPYLRYMEIDAPPLPFALFLEGELPWLKQKVVEAFAPEEPGGAPRLQLQPLRAVLREYVASGTAKKEEVEEQLTLLLARRAQIDFEETLQGFEQISRFLAAVDRLSNEELDRLHESAPLENLNPLMRNLWLPLLPSLQRSAQLLRKLYMDRDGAILAVAIAMFRHKQGRWPDSLAEALTAISLRPAERYSPKGDFIYRLEKDFPLLYSIGDDREDNGGLPLYLRGPDKRCDDVYGMPPALRQRAVEGYWERKEAERSRQP